MAASLVLEKKKRDEGQQLPLANIQSSNSSPWIFGSIFSLGGASFASYKAAESIVSSKKSAAGFAFGAGVLICLGFCGFCISKVMNSLTTRRIEPTSPSQTEETTKTHLQMLKEFERRLKTILPPEENSDLDTDETLSPYDSINKELLRLETTVPEMSQQIFDLKETVRVALEKKTTAASSRQLDFSTEDSAVDISTDDETSFEQDLFSRLDALSAKIDKDKSSRSGSRTSSAASSPARPSHLSRKLDTPSKPPLSSSGSNKGGESPLVRLIEEDDK